MRLCISALLLWTYRSQYRWLRITLDLMTKGENRSDMFSQQQQLRRKHEQSITPDNNRMTSSEKSDYIEGEREK